MADDIKTKAVGELAETVNMATSEANRTMLRLATEAAVEPGKAKRAGKIMHLAQLFDEAADHLADAHKRLFAEPDETEAALADLDRALVCLKQISLADEAEPKADAPQRHRSVSA